MRILALFLKEDLIFSPAKYSLTQKFRSSRKSAYWHSWADACYRWGCYYQRNSGTSCWSFTRRRKFKNCHELSEILGQSKSSSLWRRFDVTLQRPTTTLRTLPPKMFSFSLSSTFSSSSLAYQKSDTITDLLEDYFSDKGNELDETNSQEETVLSFVKKVHPFYSLRLLHNSSSLEYHDVIQRHEEEKKNCRRSYIPTWNTYAYDLRWFIRACIQRF